MLQIQYAKNIKIKSIKIEKIFDKLFNIWNRYSVSFEDCVQKVIIHQKYKFQKLTKQQKGKICC